MSTQVFNVIFSMISMIMEPDKEHIRHYLLFCFHQKKSAADAHRIICETYDENVSH